MKIEFYRHSLTEKDIQNVADVLRSVFLTTGPVTAVFEEKFSQFAGLKQTVALASCTAGIQLSLLALDIGPGDEVITTPMTFIATATAILHTGAKPVFVDIEPDTGLIDPNLVESAVTPRTKAIMPVHLYGTMADMRCLRTIADRHGLFIIEDSAHCVEGERDGVRPGHLSDVACFSFYATKNLTCGEGGAVATDNETLAGKIRTLRQHGMSKEAADRYHGNYQHWDMVELGWKCNMDDIHAALLTDQMDRLESLWKRREELDTLYRVALRDVRGLSIPSIVGRSAYHLLTIQVPSDLRDDMLREMGNRGIGVAVNYRSIHTLSWFRKHLSPKPEAFPKSLRFGEQTLSLPFYPLMADEDVERVARAVKDIISSWHSNS